MNRFIQKIKRDSMTTTVGILSAGIGNRIKSNEPRSLLKVGNKTLLEHQISVIRNVFSEPEIIVGLGVGANKVIKKIGFNARYIENQLYEFTGSAETMRLILNNSDAYSILFFHGDLYFGQELLQNLTVLLTYPPSFSLSKSTTFTGSSSDSCSFSSMSSLQARIAPLNVRMSWSTTLICFSSSTLLS